MSCLRYFVVFAVALLLVPATLARGVDAPLPPVDVLATATEAGTVITWQPPLYDGGHPITAYSIHRLQDHGIGWTQIGTVTAEATSFTDPEAVTGVVSIYHVLAYNEAGTSPQSQPASTSQGKAMCEPIIIEGTDVGIDKNCLPIELAILHLEDP